MIWNGAWKAGLEWWAHVGPKDILVPFLGGSIYKKTLHLENLFREHWRVQAEAMVLQKVGKIVSYDFKKDTCSILVVHLTGNTIETLNNALQSWILRPFSGWRCCFHGHLGEIRDSLKQDNRPSD